MTRLLRSWTPGFDLELDHKLGPRFLIERERTQKAGLERENTESGRRKQKDSQNKEEKNEERSDPILQVMRSCRVG